MSPDVTAILFDAGNTLVFVDPRRALEVLVDFGAPDDEEAFGTAERSARLQLSRHLARPAPPSEESAWRGYFARLLAGLGVPAETRREAGRALWESHQDDHMWTRTDPATPAALRRLADAGYRLGVVSNADGRMPELMERVGLAGHFEFVVDSHRVGYAKPDSRIFQVALEQLGLRGRQALYVGDLYAIDVVGARGAGLHPVLVDPFDGFGDPGPPVDRVRGVPGLPAWLGAP